MLANLARTAAAQTASTSNSHLPATPALAAAALSKHPIATSLTYVYHNLAYASVLYGALTLLGVPAPPELGAAFAVNRLTTRLRLPAVLAVAAALTKLRPAYSRLRLTHMLMAPITNYVSELEAAEAAKAAPTTSSNSSSNRSSGGSAAGSGPPSPSLPPPPPPPPESLQLRGMRLVSRGMGLVNMNGLLDKYGLGYVLGGRIVSTGSLLGLYWLLSTGIDVASIPLADYVPSWLLSDGGAVGTVAGWMARWTEACLLINLTYPLVLRYGVARVALVIGDVGDNLDAALKEAEAEEEQRKRRRQGGGSP